MRFYNVETGRPTNIPESQVRYVDQTIKGKSGVRKITFAKARSPTGQKLSKIISNVKAKRCRYGSTKRKSPKTGKTRCRKRRSKSPKRRSKSPKRRCKYGVNKITKKCLKSPRRK